VQQDAGARRECSRCEGVPLCLLSEDDIGGEDAEVVSEYIVSMFFVVCILPRISICTFLFFIHHVS
jgi:hypothetical protein